MSHESSWPIIENAVAGGDRARRDFTTRYLPVIRAYLGARWQGRALSGELDDAVQDVFVECFRDAGALQPMKLNREAGQDFRGFLLGVVRNVARRVEARYSARRECSIMPGPRTSCGRRHNGKRPGRRAVGPLRSSESRSCGCGFHEGLAIREIAKLWDVPPARLHHEYAKAREDFRAALREIVGMHHHGSEAMLDGECERLLDLLH